MDPLEILKERYPGQELVPAIAYVESRSRPCHLCGEKTSAYMVQNDKPQTFQKKKFIYARLKVISICLACKTDTGIGEISQCLGREAP